MSRNRQTIRGREEVIGISEECSDRNCGDCQDPECVCHCHGSRDEEEIEETT